MEESIKEEIKAMKIEVGALEEAEAIGGSAATKIVGMPNYVSISDNSNVNGKKIEMIKQYLEVTGDGAAYLSIVYINEVSIGWMYQNSKNEFKWECHIPNMKFGNTESKTCSCYGCCSNIVDAIKELVSDALDKSMYVLAWAEDAKKLYK
jgi:hypothetical protein